MAAPVKNKVSFGDRYYQWEVVGDTVVVGGVRKVPCKCTCGFESVVALTYLVSGKSKSCKACRCRSNARSQREIPDADQKHVIRWRHRWRAMHRRCSNPSCDKYYSYGGRGIKVDAEFNTFKGFWDYVSTLEGFDDPNLELDRIDTEQNYTSSNLRLTTHRDNVRNKRGYRSYPYRDKNLCIVEVHEMCSTLKYTRVQYLLTKKNWTVEQVLAEDKQ